MRRLLTTSGLLAGVLALAGPAAAADHTLWYSPEGQLLEALPQIERGDTIELRIEPVADQRDPMAFEYVLMTDCTGDGVTWTRTPFETDALGLVASFPQVCVAWPGLIRWQIESRGRGSIPVQDLLHPAIRGYTEVARAAESAVNAGGAEPDDESWRALQGAMTRVNAVVAEVQAMGSGYAASEFRLVLEPLPFPADALQARPASEEAWQALYTLASEAFEPYRQEMADVSADVGDAGQSMAEAQAQLPALQRERGSLLAALENAATIEMRQLLIERNQTIDAEIANLERQVHSAQSKRNRAPSSLTSLVHPVIYNAYGETLTGWRNRVITIDPESHLFLSTDVPIDDHDHVWLAIANATRDWSVVDVTETPAEQEPGRLSMIGERGSVLGDPVPEIVLRSPRPDYRIIIDDLSVRRGHQEVSFTIESDSGAAGGSYYVRRTYHVALKGGVAMNYIHDRSLEFVDSESGEHIYDNGIPRTTSPRGDLEPAVLIGLAIYAHPHDLLDDKRKPGWMRVMPHLYVGWSPTDPLRGFVGLGFEPFTGFSLEGGATLGSRPVLKAPNADGDYVWTTQNEFATGWFIALNADLSLFEKLFGKQDITPPIVF